MCQHSNEWGKTGSVALRSRCPLEKDVLSPLFFNIVLKVLIELLIRKMNSNWKCGMKIILVCILHDS